MRLYTPTKLPPSCWKESTACI